MPDKYRTARAYFKGVNFMTNEIVECKKSGRFVYELSTGTFLNSTIYGVTLADRATGESLHDQSRMFEDLAPARSYIANLGA